MNIIRTVLRGILVSVVVSLMAAYALADEAASRKTCENLAALSTKTFRVETSEWVAASRLSAGPGGGQMEVPAHCLFRVLIDPRPSTLDGVSFGTGVELRLPLAWNGRMLFQGGGGLNGVLNPALGTVSGFPSALARGFVVVSTDGGHRGRSAVDSSFAVDQQAKLDFAY
ncbi:MAG TPA: tannase/feruloyl esterase family alpha/beta hydrolase, partial [Acidobacteriota bacterium]|nr:tannase/feruloyl esterase family alpha/beta hydrolase [Acidobacteriota bacterium]